MATAVYGGRQTYARYLLSPFRTTEALPTVPAGHARLTFSIILPTPDWRLLHMETSADEVALEPGSTAAKARPPAIDAVTFLPTLDQLFISEAAHPDPIFFYIAPLLACAPATYCSHLRFPSLVLFR